MLADFPALRDLDESERSRLLSTGRHRRFARREVVFHEGDPGDCLHLVLDGRVSLRVSTPMGDEMTLALLGRGEMVGELAVLTEDARRVSTAVALEPTRTLAVRRDELGKLRRRNPGIDRMLTDALAAQVRRLSATVLDLLYQPVDKRVARRLADLTPLYGSGARAVEIPLTQDDVASFAGTTRATANRALRALASGEVISLARGRITVMDHERLLLAGS
ncbi:MAG: Crp/Fnr family transcriptional regulator [Pseudonocardia sp.]|nr:Crp/Fnr family transcriptional regulator [Pseudonocardia sp.]